MLRANVKVTESLLSGFTAACGLQQRILVVGIESEQLVLEKQIPKDASEEIDFDNLVPSCLDDDKPAFVLFARDDGVSWILVLYVPETAKVRSKMMFASSRDDLKAQLGSTYFTAEYQCNHKSDLSFDALRRSGTFGGSDGPEALTAYEEQIKRERRMSKDRSVTSSAMATVKYALSEELISTLQACRSGNRSCVEIILDPKTESLSVGPTDPSSTALHLSETVQKTEPRFFILSCDRGNGFIYYCPENANVRLKMTYSTAKATVLDNCEASGLQFINKFECRSADEFSQVWTEVEQKESRVAQKFAKPQRKQRSRTRARKKFVPPA